VESPGRFEFFAREMPASTARAVAFAFAFVGALLCASVAHGFFMSDDFVQLANFGHWDESGTLAAELANRFHSSIDGVNGFYRPLTFVSFAANYVLNGANATAWVAVNLALHLANAALVGMLVAMLAADRTRAALAGAAAAGVVFFAFSPGWEVALWPACRYDSLATFFTLSAGVCFLARRPGWAVAATVAGLMCKESACVAIVLVALLAVPRVESERHGETLAARARLWIRLVAPWIVIGALYVAWRIAIFGSATHVYRDVHVDLASLEHWRRLLASSVVWGHQVFPGLPGLRALLLLGSALVLAAGIALAAARSRDALLRYLVVLAALVCAPALLLPHLPFAGESNGAGGRLFYQAAAFYAIAIGLAVHEAGLALRARPAVSGAVLALVALLVVAHSAWGWIAAEQYASAQRSMRALAAELAQLAAHREPRDYFVVIVPDAVGRVVFARNAQAGLMLPPVQREPLSPVLLVQTEPEIGGLDRQIDSGTIGILRRGGLFDLLEGRVHAETKVREEPTRYFCWNAARRAMLSLPVDTSLHTDVAPRVARAFETAGCRDGEARR
jgi:hypothetical protein